MTSLKDTLRRLNASESTCREITALYKHADILTKNGSGRTWSYGQNALAAVCAFTASERLGNLEISKDQARAAACIDAKTFEAALSAAGRILFSPSSSKAREGGITYQTLVKQYNVKREDAPVIMMEVQHCLQDNKVETSSPAMQAGIFYWVCTIILQISLPTDDHMRKLINVTLKDWSAARRSIEKYCTPMKPALIHNAKTAVSINSRARATPRKASTLHSPNGLASAVINGSICNTQEMKRKASLREINEQESPLKRLRGAGSLYTPSRLGQGSTDRTPKCQPSYAPSRIRLSISCNLGKEQADDDSEEDSVAEAIVTESHTPNDFDAFFAERPINPAKALRHSEDRADTARTVGKPDGTPMTSTGASEISSPSSLLRSRSRYAATTTSMTANKRFLPVTEIEELSRWRRRNLRAPFLDPSAFGWRLSLAVAKRYAKARSCEKEMIKKYGDPWETM